MNAEELERLKKEQERRDESGYSETDSDLDAEIRAGEWQALGRFKTYQQRSRQGKIIASYQAVSNRLNQLVGMYYRLMSGNPKKGEVMLAEIKKLRLIQEILLQCLSWEPTGQLDKDMIPADVWELIK